MSRILAPALILLSALGFGSMALFAKIAYAEGISPTMVLALRFALAVLILAPIVGLRRLPLPRGRALAGFALMGVLYTGQSQSYFTALMHASSGLVGMLLYLYPILVTIIAVALGWEKLDRRTLVLLLLAVAGLAIMLGGDLQGDPLGIGLGLLAATIYSIYIVTGGRLTRGTDPLAGTLVIMAGAALGNGALAVAGGSALPASAAAWLAVAAIALFSTVIAVAAFLIGIKHVGPAQASIISTIEPVITLCLGMALLGETVSRGQVAGGALVLTAVILLSMRPRPPVQAESGAVATA